MILERGRVRAIEAQGLWVETIQRSTCGSCLAQKGCGQRLLAAFGANTSNLWVLLDGRNPAAYHIGDEVNIGIPEDVVVKASLFVYMLPLLCMVLATIIAHHQAASDFTSVFYALAGLLLGGIIVRVRSYQIRFDNDLQPVLVDDVSSAPAEKHERSVDQVIQTRLLG